MDIGQSWNHLPPGLESLVDFATDILWSWSHASDRLWSYVDIEIWDRTRNPWLILQGVTNDRLKALASDKEFKKILQQLKKERKAYFARTDWFQRNHPNSNGQMIAYFSMEFGLSEALPLYTGGLGILAGDHLKTASDLGVPIVGVGLLYQQGYFRQMLNAQGYQQEFYPYNNPNSLPISPTTGPGNDWLRIELDLPGREIVLRVWQVQIGRVKLYLLDSNDPLNSPMDRGITGDLYGGGQEIRLLQEMLLGIGGWRTLTALNIQPTVLHLNEGHAAFAALERIRSFMEIHDAGFEKALWATRAGNLFTTHTPVPAGFDEFDSALVFQYFRNYAKTLGIAPEHLLAMGRKHMNKPDEPFNMAYLALRTSGAVNAVSHVHKRVSRRIFQSLYSQWPESDVPIGSITNGVHVPSWDSPYADKIWTRYCGKARWLCMPETFSKQIEAFTDEDIWGIRTSGRQQLVNYVRQRLTMQTSILGADNETIDRVQNVLDPNILTVGFARRFTAYKRPNLLLYDEERLVRLLTDARYPIQLVVAGKAHPRDEEGKRMVQRMVRFARRPEIRNRMVFLADYDMLVAEQLVQGADLWVNTPHRPWEACGTSGMKVLVNGGLNISELDGWWAEAYSPEFGWALGDEGEHLEPEWDAIEANELYRLLEEEIIPAFYDQDSRGIPIDWVRRIRASMGTLTSRFSTNRMLREYVETYYLPAATRYSQRTENNAEMAQRMVEWQHILDMHWSAVRFINLKIESGESGHHLQVYIYLDNLSPETVRVEVYAESRSGEDAPFRQTMNRKGILPGSINGYIYEITVPADRPVEHYTPRVTPVHPAALIPLEESRILWFR